MKLQDILKTTSNGTRLKVYTLNFLLGKNLLIAMGTPEQVELMLDEHAKLTNVKFMSVMNSVQGAFLKVVIESIDLKI